MIKATLVSVLLLVCCCNAGTKTKYPAHNAQDDIKKVASYGSWTWNVSSNCNPACRTVSWEKVDEVGVINVKFTLSGPDVGYLAVSISENEDMGPADDVYICVVMPPANTSDVVITSGYLTGHGPATVTGPVPTQLSSVANGSVSCTFYRPLSVTRNISGTYHTWDVNTGTFNLLYAEGPVTAAGSIRRHTYRAFTHGVFNLFKPEGTGAASSLQAQSIAILSLVVCFTYALF
uniref:Putative ferric-chelate reductase 1 n=1 Tax=Ciona intestinalis TaxID=7719 RepID=F6RQW2_CIOIN|nr:putative ferric-chelate reductase 1 [Ciona intestinalis]|eukprot:XP_002129252.1 putative ferric-chelate reductase 1 [Ciona intestinalis]